MYLYSSPMLGKTYSLQLKYVYAFAPYCTVLVYLRVEKNKKRVRVWRCAPPLYIRVSSSIDRISSHVSSLCCHVPCPVFIVFCCSKPRRVESLLIFLTLLVPIQTCSPVLVWVCKAFLYNYFMCMAVNVCGAIWFDSS